MSSSPDFSVFTLVGRDRDHGLRSLNFEEEGLRSHIFKLGDVQRQSSLHFDVDERSANGLVRVSFTPPPNSKARLRKFLTCCRFAGVPLASYEDSVEKRVQTRSFLCINSFPGHSLYYLLYALYVAYDFPLRSVTEIPDMLYEWKANTHTFGTPLEPVNLDEHLMDIVCGEADPQLALFHLLRPGALLRVPTIVQRYEEIHGVSKAALLKWFLPFSASEEKEEDGKGDAQASPFVVSPDVSEEDDTKSSASSAPALPGGQVDWRIRLVYMKRNQLLLLQHEIDTLLQDFTREKNANTNTEEVAPSSGVAARQVNNHVSVEDEDDDDDSDVPIELADQLKLAYDYRRQMMVLEGKIEAIRNKFTQAKKAKVNAEERIVPSDVPEKEEDHMKDDDDKSSVPCVPKLPDWQNDWCIRQAYQKRSQMVLLQKEINSLMHEFMQRKNYKSNEEELVQRPDVIIQTITKDGYVEDEDDGEIVPL